MDNPVLIDLVRGGLAAMGTAPILDDQGQAAHYQVTWQALVGNVERLIAALDVPPPTSSGKARELGELVAAGVDVEPAEVELDQVIADGH